MHCVSWKNERAAWQTFAPFSPRERRRNVAANFSNLHLNFVNASAKRPIDALKPVNNRALMSVRRLVITERARADLEDILLYTELQWDEIQVAVYEETIYNALANLVHFPG